MRTTGVLGRRTRVRASRLPLFARIGSARRPGTPAVGMTHGIAASPACRSSRPVVSTTRSSRRTPIWSTRLNRLFADPVGVRRPGRRRPGTCGGGSSRGCGSRRRSARSSAPARSSLWMPNSGSPLRPRCPVVSCWTRRRTPSSAHPEAPENSNGLQKMSFESEVSTEPGA